MRTAEAERVHGLLAWAAAGLCATMFVAGGLLPGFSLGRDEFRGGVLTDPHSHALLSYGSARYLAALALALAGLGGAAAALAARRPGWVAPAVLLVGAGPALVSLWGFLGAEEGHDDPNANFPNVPGVGWRLTNGVLLALAAGAAVWLGRELAGLEALTSYAAGAVTAYFLGTLVLVATWGDGGCRSYSTYAAHDPDYGEALLVYPAAGLAVVGVGALWRGHWRAALTFILGTGSALLCVAVIAFGKAMKCFGD